MVKLHRFSAFVLLLAFLFSVGCASIVSKSDYPVAISSSPDGADITITDKTGVQIYKGKTPTTVTLKSGAGFFSGASYDVAFERDDCEPQIMHIEREPDGWYIGNILFGGVIGMLIVDPATGAMWKLPPSLHANLAHQTTTLKFQDETLEVVLLQDVPADLRPQLLRINRTTQATGWPLRLRMTLQGPAPHHLRKLFPLLNSTPNISATVAPMSRKLSLVPRSLAGLFRL